MREQRLWLVAVMLLVGACFDPLYDPLAATEFGPCCGTDGVLGTCACDKGACSAPYRSCAPGADGQGRCTPFGSSCLGGAGGGIGGSGGSGGSQDAGSGGAGGGQAGGAGGGGPQDAGSGGGTGGGAPEPEYEPCCSAVTRRVTTCECIGRCQSKPFVSCGSGRCHPVEEGLFCPP